MADLKPCPFCGGTDLATPPMQPVVVCGTCDAAGPWGKPLARTDAAYNAAAYEAWNTRKEQPK